MWEHTEGTSGYVPVNRPVPQPPAESIAAPSPMKRKALTSIENVLV